MSITKEDLEKLFCIHYDARIQHSGTYISRPIPFKYNLTQFPNTLSDMVDRIPIISVDIPKDKYERFITHYGMFLDLLSQLNDPIVSDEFHKLMMLVELKK